MELLIDTHTLLWFAEGDNQRLSITARQALENAMNSKYVSIASFWEIGIKLSTGKLELQRGLSSLIDFVKKANFQILPIEFNHIEIVKNLPFIHRDPFDRMLVAQAEHDDLSLVTVDKNIKKYPIKTIW
jgi:PIN domain nuclease of toxin-antitoxin system